MRMKWFGAAIAIAATLSLAAEPAERSNSRAEKIAFGFDKLQWGMAQQDASALYHFHPGMTYDYAGCRFRLLPIFVANKLVLFDLLATGTGASKPCEGKIEAELAARYGQPWRRTVGAPNSPLGSHADWRRPGLEVTYNAFKLEDEGPGGPGFDGKVEIMFGPPHGANLFARPRSRADVNGAAGGSPK